MVFLKPYHILACCLSYPVITCQLRLLSYDFQNFGTFSDDKPRKIRLTFDLCQLSSAAMPCIKRNTVHLRPPGSTSIKDGLDCNKAEIV